jgi:8-oxo-dGTP pyrophosphatase MutT (NUDIX family)
MYKIFFQDRFVILSEKIPRGKAGHGQVFEAFQNQTELKELLENFTSKEQVQELFIYHPDLEELSHAFSTCFKGINAGGGVVFNERGEFLAIKRNGIWDLPKGKMEKREDFETTALREVEEECGLTGLKIVGLLLSTFHTYPLKGRMIMKETQWFEMRWSGSGKPVLQSEEGITDFRWVKPGECDFIKQNSYASILDVLKVRNLLDPL